MKFNNGIEQEVECKDCGFVWFDLYTLTGIDTNYDKGY